MKHPILTKILGSAMMMAVSVLLFIFPTPKLPYIDAIADQYFTDSISHASIAYATCRAINASVSILKDSQVQMEPAGIGVSIAVGQALDPIDDMTERLSDMLVTAITSLGVQKIMYEIGISFAPPLIAALFAVLSVLIWIQNTRVEMLFKAIGGILILVIAARLCLPFSSIINMILQEKFFETRIEKVKNELALGIADVNKLQNFNMPKSDGFLDKFKNSASLVHDKIISYKDAFLSTISNAGEIINNLVELTFLYAGVFIVQVLLLPFLSFFIITKIANAIFPYSNIERCFVKNTERG